MLRGRDHAFPGGAPSRLGRRLAPRRTRQPRLRAELCCTCLPIEVEEGDETRVERLLDQMLEHQTPSRRFMSYGTSRMSPEPVWGSLLCDTHAITEVLVRFGRAEDPRFEPRWTACAKIWCSRPRVAPGRASPTQ